MTIPFIDLKTQYQLYKKELDRAVMKVLDHGQYVMGAEVKDLESTLAEYIGVKHVLACSSGTDALVLPLMTKSLKSSDAVFTTPFTFFASAESITLAGATPVFVDIDPDTYNLCPAALEKKVKEVIIDGQLTPKGILPVDLFGVAADYDAINAIAKKYDLFVLEDAAQSFAAKYKDNKACGLAEVAATSFYPAKPLGCYGDGGAIFTNNSDIYDHMLSLRVHGQSISGNKYDNVRIGLNARMDTIQAAVLLEKLKFYDKEIELRNHVADLYKKHLDGAVKTPTVPSHQGSVWAQYSVQHDERDKIVNGLKEQGIPTAIFYPIPIHLSTAYQGLGYKRGDFPISERIADRIFSLPMHPYLKSSQVVTITEAVKNAVSE